MIRGNIWLEQLRLTDIVIFMLKGLYSSRRVYYDENQITHRAKKFLEFLKSRNLCGNFHEAKLNLNIKDSKGFALYYDFEEDLNACFDAFCNKYLRYESVRIVKTVKSYLGFYLFYRLAFIKMVAAKISEGEENLKNEIFLIRHPLNYLIIDFYKTKRFKIRQLASAKGYIDIMIRPLYSLFKIFFQIASIEKIKGNVDKNRVSVWVECNAIFPVDGINFLFWSKYVDKDSFQIVYYLDRKDTPISPENIAHIEQEDARWIDCHNLYRLAELNLQKASSLFNKSIFIKKQKPLWLNFFRLQYCLLEELYTLIFKKYKVKVLIQHQEFSWIQEVQSRAIESAGGIMLGFHWSNFPYTLEPTHLTPEHIYFVWGKIKYEWVKSKGESCRYIFPSGLWIVSDRKSDYRLRESFKNHSFVLAIFDSSVSYNIYVSPENLSLFYRKVLNLIEEHPTWGALIKSKIFNNIDTITSLPSGRDIAIKLNSLLKKEQLLFLPAKTSPVEVAANADLSVCFSLNSAGIVAGIHGFHAIHWDCSGWLHHPFYRDPDQKITYLYIDDFTQAIINASKGDREIGDFSRWKHKFNYFDDFQGNHRIGKFIQSYMENTLHFDNPKDSLDSAVKKYIEENKIEDNSFEIDNLWEHSEKFKSETKKVHCIQEVL